MELKLTLNTNLLKDTLLEPLRVLVSRNALTAYLSTFMFFATAICMIFVSALAYGVFYYNFIPRVGLERIVHLQFGLVPTGKSLPSELSFVQLICIIVHLEMAIRGASRLSNRV